MTPDESNALLARLMAKDLKWGLWAYPRCARCRGDQVVTGRTTLSGRPVEIPNMKCPACNGRGHMGPRDFGHKTNMPDLIEWASGQGWYSAIASAVHGACRRLAMRFDDAAGTASEVRDIIAKAAKEAGQ